MNTQITHNKKKYSTIVRLALKYKFLSNEQVEKAVTDFEAIEKSENKASIESFLVKKGILSLEKIQILLALKRFLIERALDQKFGKIAITKGYLTQENLNSALDIQAKEFKETKMFRIVGEIFIETGKLSQKQKDAILYNQNRLEHLDPNYEIEKKDNLSKPSLQVNIPFTIKVSNDKLFAYLVPTEKISLSIPVLAVTAFLKKNGIKHGIVDKSKIETYLENIIGKDIDSSSSFKIAEGVPSKPGVDAKLKFHINEVLHNFNLNSFNKNFNTITAIPSHKVKKDDLLIERLPSLKGEFGVDIYENVINAKNPNEIDFNIGSGIKISKDGQKAYSLTNGYLQILYDGKICVCPELKFRNDIDVKTCDIDHDEYLDVNHNAYLNILANINNSIKIKCITLFTKNIYAAEIYTKNDVIVNEGINGATITAKGNIVAGFIKNSTIMAYGNVIVINEISNSTIELSGTCKVVKGGIIASKISAKRGIESKFIGTDFSNPCELRIGTNDNFEKELQKLKQPVSLKQDELNKVTIEISENENKSKEIFEQITKLAQIQDRASIGQKSLLENISQSEASLKENKGDEKEKQKLEQSKTMLEKINNTINVVDKKLDNLFDEQEKLTEKKADDQSLLVTVKDEIKELTKHFENTKKWFNSIKPFSNIQVSDKICSKTRIIGAHISKVLEITMENVNIKEAKRIDTDTKHDSDSTEKWTFQYIAQDQKK